MIIYYARAFHIPDEISGSRKANTSITPPHHILIDIGFLTRSGGAKLPLITPRSVTINAPPATQQNYYARIYDIEPLLKIKAFDGMYCFGFFTLNIG